MKKNLLIADDDESIQLCMEEISAQEGWRVSFASDGEECLARIRREQPALVILDHRMPRLTGEEVLARLSQDGDAPPVILMSAEKELRHLRRYPFVKGVLGKPFDLEDFVNAVRSALGEL